MAAHTQVDPGVHGGCCGDPTVPLGIPSGTEPTGTGPVPAPVAGPIILELACLTLSAIHYLVLIHPWTDVQSWGGCSPLSWSQGSMSPPRTIKISQECSGSVTKD